MKKYIQMIVILIAAIMLLTGCKKEMISTDTKKEYHGKNFDYIYVMRNTDESSSISNMKLCVYSYNKKIYLYIDANIDGKNFITDEILEESLWDTVSDAILKDEEESDYTKMIDEMACVKIEDDDYKYVKPLDISLLNIDDKKLYEGTVYSDILAEQDKVLFQNTDIELSLGGNVYTVKEDDELIYKIPDAEYAFVAEQIKEALGEDNFLFVDTYTYGYRCGMKATIQADSGRYECVITGHGRLVSLYKV